MINGRPPAEKLFRAAIVTIAATAVLGTVCVGATAAQADPVAQPALTTRDHPITDVPGLVNGRELGAFTGDGGQTVNASRLIRSESLDKITAAGARTLASEYHVDLVIDLRTPSQVAEKPDVPIPGATTVNLSVFGADGDYSDDTAMYHDLVDKGYVDAANRGPMVTAYAQVLRTLATHTSGTVLIHCSHGMDRTGTVVDLLDRVLGVDSADILHDYLLSNTQLGVTWATPQLLQGTFESDIAKKYAGMDSYLSKTIGVTANEAAALRARFLVSNDASASAITVAGVSVPLGAAATTTGATITAPLPTVSAGAVRVATTSAAASTSVTVSGNRVVVTVTAQDRRTTEQYRFTVQRPTVTIGRHGRPSPGSTLELTSSGLTPGARYSVVVHSTPRVIARVTAAPDGTVAAAVTLPSDLEVGTHTLYLADAAGDEVSNPVSLTLVSRTVTPAAPTRTVAAAGPSVATGGTVAPGGPSVAWLLLGGLGACVLAVLAVLRTRARIRTGR